MEVSRQPEAKDKGKASCLSLGEQFGLSRPLGDELTKTYIR